MTITDCIPFIIGDCLVLTAYALLFSAPDGYEDDNGFHYGNPPEKLRKTFNDEDDNP